MTALKKEKLEELEAEYGLEPDGLTYQHRCSRITAYMNGEGDQWQVPPKTEARQMREAVENVSDNGRRPLRGPHGETVSRVQRHPLYGWTILITPLMTPDKNRFITYDEELGPEMEVDEYNAGEAIQGTEEDHVDRMYGEYNIRRIDPNKKVIALSGIPKINTELSFQIGHDLVPVVRGNSGKRGYIWSMPRMVVQIEDTLIELRGLKSLIQSIAPGLIADGTFSGKPMMEYIDGVTLAADIPQTVAALQRFAKEEYANDRAGFRL